MLKLEELDRRTGELVNDLLLEPLALFDTVLDSVTDSEELLL